jgi:hypothetical protein
MALLRKIALQRITKTTLLAQFMNVYKQLLHIYRNESIILQDYHPLLSYFSVVFCVVVTVKHWWDNTQFFDYETTKELRLSRRLQSLFCTQ